MLRRERIRMAAGLVALASLAPTQAQTNPAVASVDRATEQIFAPSASAAQLQAGLQSLLTAIAEAAAGLDLPAEFGSKLAEARRGQAATHKTTALLNDCYKLLNRGASFRMPESVRGMPDAMDYLRTRIAAGRDLLVKGKAEEGLRALLDAAVLIVTPFPQPHHGA
jgi:hypothetical protein